MAELIINRLRDRPIEFLDVSKEWAAEMYDKIEALKNSDVEYLDLHYRRDARSQRARIHRNNLKGFEATY